jgi:hypothetical protein
MSRRRALALGANVASGILAAGMLGSCADSTSPPGGARQSRTRTTSPAFSLSKAGELPVKQIEEILETEGTVKNGILQLEQEREDLHVVGPGGIPFLPAWEIKHEYFFQPLGRGRAFVNGDFCLLPSELNPVIDQLLAHDLVFMAEHQHFFDLHPMVFFIHFRGIGDPLQLARAVRATVRVTGTPLPQTKPTNPTTPLPAKTLARILGGEADVGDEGVVTVNVPRREQIVVAGVHLEPEMGVEHTIAFEPLGGGQHAAVAPDFALIGAEVNPVARLMRAQGWQIHCLYNQETDEFPQLYFSHQLKVGDAVQLAREIRRGLDQQSLRTP